MLLNLKAFANIDIMYQWNNIWGNGTLIMLLMVSICFWKLNSLLKVGCQHLLNMWVHFQMTGNLRNARKTKSCFTIWSSASRRPDFKFCNALARYLYKKRNFNFDSKMNIAESLSVCLYVLYCCTYAFSM